MNEKTALDFIEQAFHQSRNIRYVAVYQEKRLISRQRQMVEEASDSESDRYEELLVNPTLLLLAKQRGDIDCGGLRFLIVSYGNFYQYVRPYREGHISVCIEKDADPREEGRLIDALLASF